MPFWFYYIFGVCGALNPLLLHQHIGNIYNYIIELSMLVHSNHIFAPHIS